MQLVETHKPLGLHGSKLNSVIGKFWDKVSPLWNEIWGPHIHHGYYEGVQIVSPIEAQERLIDEILQLLELPPTPHVFDVGCGMGGSAIYLHKKLGAHVQGITLSAIQREIAKQKADNEKCSGVEFSINDALSMQGIPNEAFDLAWSLESCEQFADKPLFLRNVFARLKPGGKLMLATWCSNSEIYRDADAKKYKQLCEAFDLPYMPTMEFYQRELSEAGFGLLTTFDWAEQVESSWDLGITKVSKVSMLVILLRGGWRSWQFVRQLPLMRAAYREKRIAYGVFIAEKPLNAI